MNFVGKRRTLGLIAGGCLVNGNLGQITMQRGKGLRVPKTQ